MKERWRMFLTTAYHASLLLLATAFALDHSYLTAFATLTVERFTTVVWTNEEKD